MHSCKKFRLVGCITPLVRSLSAHLPTSVFLVFEFQYRRDFQLAVSWKLFRTFRPIVFPMCIRVRKLVPICVAVLHDRKRLKVFKILKKRIYEEKRESEKEHVRGELKFYLHLFHLDSFSSFRGEIKKRKNIQQQIQLSVRFEPVVRRYYQDR